MLKNQPKKPYANMPEHFRSLLPALPAAPHLRRCRAINRRPPFATLALLAALVPLPAFAATPSPHPPQQQQPKDLLPKHAEHTEFVVEINKLGQVTRIRSTHGSDSATFNGQTYGNALQSFIRTPDGHVVLGTYKLTYDYDPKTAHVRRDVTLLSQGGVDPEAKGAALVLMEKDQRGKGASTVTPGPAASVDPGSLPDLPSISEPTPLPRPH